MFSAQRIQSVRWALNEFGDLSGWERRGWERREKGAGDRKWQMAINVDAHFTSTSRGESYISQMDCYKTTKIKQVKGVFFFFFFFLFFFSLSHMIGKRD